MSGARARKHGWVLLFGAVLSGQTERAETCEMTSDVRYVHEAPDERKSMGELLGKNMTVMSLRREVSVS